jgi:hypothetical protein
MRTSSSKDRLSLRKGIRSENNFQRRLSNTGLRDFDFGIRQNAMKSNRNLISSDDAFLDSITLDKDKEQNKVNHSETYLYNSTPFNPIELPNGTKCNLKQLEYLNNRTNKIMNGNQQQQLQYYDYNDRLINDSDLASNQLNDLNFEQYDSYDSSFYLDSYPKEHLKNKKCSGENGRSNEDYSSNSSKSQSYPNLKFF